MDNHIILTPFNQTRDWVEFDIYEVDENGTSWMDRRFELFETYYIPAFANQTDKDFHVFLLCDPNTPEKYKKVLGDLTTQYKWLNCLFTNDNKTEDFEKQVLTQYQLVRENDSNDILVSRVDNDDSVHITYVENLKRANLHGSGLETITYSEGLFWEPKTNKCLFSHFPTCPFLTTICTLDSFINPFEDNHHNMTKKYKWSEIKANKIPMWMSIVHEENLWNRMDRMPGVPIEINVESLKVHFGLSDSL